MTTNEAQHTPGPWTARNGIEDDDHLRWGVVQAGPTPYLIAVVENGAPGDTLQTERANAHLIAAAPALLAALEGLCYSISMRYGVSDGYDQEAYEDAERHHGPAIAQRYLSARRALAAAKGTK